MHERSIVFCNPAPKTKAKNVSRCCLTCPGDRDGMGQMETILEMLLVLLQTGTDEGVGKSVADRKCFQTALPVTGSTKLTGWSSQQRAK